MSRVWITTAAPAAWPPWLRAAHSHRPRKLLLASKRAFGSFLGSLRPQSGIDALSGLDDRMLRDIGIERTHLPSIVRGGVETRLRARLAD
jgi:Domain of unknown function (DUF1127)